MIKKYGKIMFPTLKNMLFFQISDTIINTERYNKKNSLKNEQVI